MGNFLSRSKNKNKQQITKDNQIESEQEREERELIEYYFSNDFDSLDLLHTYHFFKRCLFQSNFSSPIEDKLIQGCKVLDIGCGPGTWLLDLSNKYENSLFFGLDIKSIFPLEIKPNNLEFIEADIFNGLPFRDNEFDFARIDNMCLILTVEQWDFALSELIRVTKSGGYIEVADRRNDYDDEGPIFDRLSKGVWSTCSKRNVDVDLIFNLDSKFELQPNIEKVHRAEKKCIVGPNGGKIGQVFQDLVVTYFSLEMSIKNLSIELGISEQEFKNMVEKDLIEEFKQTYPECTHIRFWAQKQ
ncbi:S-adenosyl-L-methionine-dependent methyltransferase [Glomus cerebriforme]|uniref:S-adenosyl-L-methionine-dependent methyltransferase n=1 Tax=Glomus cerebriforme TaxID=658196 RepID=A0A397TS35_9GLOM|nr:S-adenosyl-L-methionine-dependent methyltransferase [Glomus cerebriforme]